MARLGRGQPRAIFTTKSRLISAGAGTGSVVGSFSLVGAGTVSYPLATGSVVGSFALTAPGLPTGPAVGAVAGSFALTGTGVVTYAGTGSIVGSFALVGAGTGTFLGVGSVTGGFALTGNGTVTGPGTIYIQGPISARWLPAMQAAILKTFTYADIWSGIGGTKLVSQAKVTAGSVTVDRSNAVRRTAQSVTFLPDSAGVLLPTTTGAGALYPTGAEIQLYKGCIYPDGSAEVASLGRFLIGEMDVNDDATGVTLIGTLQDRAQTVARATFAEPYSTYGVLTADAVIQAIISNQVSGLSYSFTPSTFVPPIQTFNIGDDPWAAAQAIATSAGMELFFDQNGVCILQLIVDPATIAPCAVYLEGTPAAPVAIKREISNTSVPNVCCVISSGSNISPPIQTFWWDNNPSSRTYYASGTPGPTLPARSGSSTYPTYLVTINSTAATTLAQAQAIANSAGLTYIGTIEGAIIQIRDNPAHNVNDVVTLLRVSAGIEIPSNYVVDHVQIDLTPTTALQLTTRLVIPGS